MTPRTCPLCRERPATVLATVHQRGRLVDAWLVCRACHGKGGRRFAALLRRAGVAGIMRMVVGRAGR